MIKDMDSRGGLEEVKVVYRPTRDKSHTVTHQNVNEITYSSNGSFVTVDTVTRSTTYNMDKVVCITHTFQ